MKYTVEEAVRDYDILYSAFSKMNHKLADNFLDEDESNEVMEAFHSSLLLNNILINKVARETNWTGELND